MIKKIAVEKHDLQKTISWKDSRKRNLDKIIEELLEDEETYVVGLDIASEDSKDNSVMMKFRFVDGNYIYEGCEKI